MKKPFGAIAIDLGATSGRFAAGSLDGGRIVSEVIEQLPHSAIDRGGHATWDIDALLRLCQRAVQYAQAHFTESYVGIDSWGVDVGFIDSSGQLMRPPICYRDPSHQAQFDKLKVHRNRIFELTGIAHQPFNTVYQLAARKFDSPELVGARWLNIPDLLGLMLCGANHHEATMASTTQLMGLDGKWCEELFDLVGWPMPDLEPTLPGRVGASIAPSVHLSHVGSHDTASAIFGLGDIPNDAMFLNLGTWSLAGVLLDRPISTPEAEAAGFTNEWAVDGRIRFLKNIPGFYVLNRLHDELDIQTSIPQWIERADDVDERINLMHPDLYNPKSMPEAVMKLSGWDQATEAQWAGLAVHSLTSTIAAQIPDLQRITGRKIDTIRVSGGGSRSEVLCQSLARATKRKVVAGPVEATVTGNLAMSLQARALHENRADAYTHDLASSLVSASPREQLELHDSILATLNASADLRTFGAPS